MWWALGVIGVLLLVNAVLGWRLPLGHDGDFESWSWFSSGDDSGWSGDCGGWGGDCSSD
jgi:hypothetical protein